MKEQFEQRNGNAHGFIVGETLIVSSLG